MDEYSNLAISTVTRAPGLSGTDVQITTGHGIRFPSPPFNVTVWPKAVYPDPTNAEIARVLDIVGDTLTIARAQEGTMARKIVVGDLLALTITKKVLDDLRGTPGPGGAVLVVRETPTGIIDGVNTTFLLMNTPVVGSEQVFLNGLLQEANVDYGIHDNVITFLMPPQVGDRVLVTYGKEN